jgi:deazaflavin-dependent oxidoreductase (nitroreductase family)
MRRWVLRGLAVVALLIMLAALGLVHDMTDIFAGQTGAGGATAAGSLRDRLAGIADRSVLRLTHYGRKTGAAHEVTTWFAVDGETLYVPTSDRGRQWTRNVQHTPRVQVRIGPESFAGMIAPVSTDPEMHRVYALLKDKYWTIWLIARGAELSGRDPDREPLDLGRGGFYRVDVAEEELPQRDTEGPRGIRIAPVASVSRCDDLLQTIASPMREASSSSRAGSPGTRVCSASGSPAARGIRCM